MARELVRDIFNREMEKLMNRIQGLEHRGYEVNIPGLEKLQNLVKPTMKHVNKLISLKTQTIRSTFSKWANPETGEISKGREAFRAEKKFAKEHIKSQLPETGYFDFPEIPEMPDGYYDRSYEEALDKANTIIDNYEASMRTMVADVISYGPSQRFYNFSAAIDRYELGLENVIDFIESKRSENPIATAKMILDATDAGILPDPGVFYDAGSTKLEEFINALGAFYNVDASFYDILNSISWEEPM